VGEKRKASDLKTGDVILWRAKAAVVTQAGFGATTVLVEGDSYGDLVVPDTETVVCLGNVFQLLADNVKGSR
jgi:hypothetical protein